MTGFDRNGLYVQGSDAILGGPAPGRRNVLSRNTMYGIKVDGDGTTEDRVLGNNIGTDAAGGGGGGNGVGIHVGAGAQFTLIDQTDALLTALTGVPAPQPPGSDVDQPVGIGPARGFATWLHGSRAPQPRGPLLAANESHGILIDQDGGPTGVAECIILENGVHGLATEGRSGAIEFTNTIVRNAVDGVNVSGTDAQRNMLARNSISANGGKGIPLAAGAKAGIGRPIITSATAATVSGSGCPAGLVEVFSDTGNQGLTYDATVPASEGGTWLVSGSFGGPNVTATCRDPDGNTSEFSLPWSIGGVTATASATSHAATASPTATVRQTGTATEPGRTDFPTAPPTAAPTETAAETAVTPGAAPPATSSRTPTAPRTPTAEAPTAQPTASSGPGAARQQLLLPLVRRDPPGSSQLDTMTHASRRRSVDALPGDREETEV